MQSNITNNPASTVAKVATNAKLLRVKHPATTLGDAQFQNLKLSKNSTNTVLKTGFDLLSKDVRLDYKSRALVRVDIGPYGVGIGHDEFIGDSMQIYNLALMYIASNDYRFMKKAIELQDDWNKKCKSFKGSNAPLECAWGGTIMIRALELLKYSKPPNIPWDIEFEKRFKIFIQSVILPNLVSRYNEITRWNNNWILTIQEALLQYYLYVDDIVNANRIIEDFQAALIKCVPHDCGMCTETKRDLIHTQFQLGSIVQVMEMCYHQGIDIYNIHANRIYRCMEYHGSILNGSLPQPLKKEELKDVWFMPCVWEIGHNHFTHRKPSSITLTMPETSKLLNSKRNRPEKLTFNWGPAWIHHKTK